MKVPDINFEIGNLILKFLKGALSPVEKEKLDQWIDEKEDNKAFLERLTDPEYLEQGIRSLKERDKAFYWEKLKAEIDRQHKARFSTVYYRTRKYAAVLLPLLIIGAIAAYLLLSKPNKEMPRSEVQTTAAVLPKGKTARLVLGNGKVVMLNDSTIKPITEKDGTKVSSNGRRLQYKEGKEDFAKTVYNTLYTPRGGEYQVTLSDGTKVWLNAASSLRYPTRFEGSRRKVYLSGEGYFEVARKEKNPFLVEMDGARVEVLGTRFNISFYKEDGKKSITLVDGAIRVARNKEQKESVVLQPGYRVQLMKNRAKMQVQKVNVESVLAWKNGLFVFDGESLRNIMKELTRWYDVEVNYEKGTDTLHFRGRVKKYQDIRGVLHFIEMTNKVRFTIKGRHINVLPAV